MLGPGLKRNLFSTLATAQKGLETIIVNNRLSLDLGTFRVQLTRSDNMDYLGLTIAKESSRNESTLCTISIW